MYVRVCLYLNQLDKRVLELEELRRAMAIMESQASETDTKAEQMAAMQAELHVKEQSVNHQVCMSSFSSETAIGISQDIVNFTKESTRCLSPD